MEKRREEQNEEEGKVKGGRKRKGRIKRRAGSSTCCCSWPICSVILDRLTLRSDSAAASCCQSAYGSTRSSDLMSRGSIPDWTV